MSTTKTAQYRKKPVVIEAIQWDGTASSTIAIENFMGLELEILGKGLEGKLVIPTLEGATHASIDDYIIKGVKGEFYACKPDIFEMTYEKA